MMSVRFIHVDKLTIHCFNISRVGVGREGRLHSKVLLLLKKNRTTVSVKLVVGFGRSSPYLPFRHHQEVWTVLLGGLVG